jgi:hypothetical protein
MGFFGVIMVVSFHIFERPTGIKTGEGGFLNLSAFLGEGLTGAEYALGQPAYGIIGTGALGQDAGRRGGDFRRIYRDHNVETLVHFIPACSLSWKHEGLGQGKDYFVRCTKN